MKTKSLILTLSAALLIGLVWNIPVSARVTGTQPARTSPDRWCIGPTGAEVCVEFAGNLIPTTDNDTTLGTSALRWAAAYIMDITVGDDLTVTDDLAVQGDSALGNGTADVTTILGHFVVAFSTAPDANVTPSAANELMINTTNNSLCMSTGTAAGSWIVFYSTGGTTPCAN